MSLILVHNFAVLCKKQQQQQQREMKKFKILFSVWVFQLSFSTWTPLVPTWFLGNSPFLYNELIGSLSNDDGVFIDNATKQ